MNKVFVSPANRRNPRDEVVATGLVQLMKMMSTYQLFVPTGKPPTIFHVVRCTQETLPISSIINLLLQGLRQSAAMTTEVSF